MNKFFPAVASLILILLISFQAVDACSFSIPPLRKDFRKANSVFIGKILKIEDYYTPTTQEKQDIPADWKDTNIFSKVTFEISNKWKGSINKQKSFATVAYFGCGCPGDFSKFEEDQEYLVFAFEKNFLTVCQSDNIESDQAKDKIKQLDKFWFRTWARIYPF